MKKALSVIAFILVLIMATTMCSCDDSYDYDYDYDDYDDHDDYIRCESCNEKNDEDAKYCNSCGEKLNKKSNDSNDKEVSSKNKKLLLKVVANDPSSKTKTITTYKYDENGKLLSATVDEIWVSNSTTKDFYEITYYDSGDKNVVKYYDKDRVKYDIYNDNGIYLYTALADPKVTASEITSESTKEQTDENGNPVKVTVRVKKDSKKINIFETYNSKNEMISYEYITFNPDNTVYSAFLNKYENGNLTKKYTYNSSLSDRYLLTEQISYDSDGNKTEAKRYITEWKTKNGRSLVGEVGYSSSDANCRLIEERSTLYTHTYVTLEEYINNPLYFQPSNSSQGGSNNGSGGGNSGGGNSTNPVKCFSCGTLGAPAGKVTCIGCSGEGKVFKDFDSKGNKIMKTCSTCSGKGYKNCSICDGDGYIRD